MARLLLTLAVVSIGVAGASAPVRADDCACSNAEASACVLDVPATREQPAHTVVLWCESPDDPRCQPATPPPDAAAIGASTPSATGTETTFTWPAFVPSNAPRWVRTEDDAGPTGIRLSIDRPPRR